MQNSPFALGLGIGTQNSNGAWLEVYYPRPLLAPDQALVDALQEFASDNAYLRLI